jgi:hypothetical protein
MPPLPIAHLPCGPCGLAGKDSLQRTGINWRGQDEVNDSLQRTGINKRGFAVVLFGFQPRGDISTTVASHKIRYKVTKSSKFVISHGVSEIPFC